MVPSGPSNQLGGTPSVNPSLLRTNSNLIDGSHPPNSSMPAQTPFSSLVSPRTQFTNTNLLGNISNVSALLNRPAMNGLGHGPGTGPGDLPGPSSSRPGPLSFPSLSGNPLGQNSSQNLSEHQQGNQLEQSQDPAQHLPNGVKMELGDTNGPGSGPAQMLRNPSMVKLEHQQQLNPMRNIGPSMGPVKMEPQHNDMIMQQQLRQNSQAAAAAAQLTLLQQQRMMQLQQQQQQQMKQQRGPQPHPPQMIPQQQQQRGKTHYEPGTCAKRLTLYMYHQQKRPQDNNIDFWRNFVAEYYAPNAKKRWCVSQYGTGRQTTGVFPQDVWHCEICNRKPGRGFETTVEVLPRLCQIKYASGTIEELLYVDMPREYHNPPGQIVLDYAKAIQESVFEQLRVVREGQLRIVFNTDLKIASWEFCARRHEELIPRRSIIPQVSQLGAVVQKYQNAAQNSTALSTQDLQTTCNSFVTSARSLAKALEVPLVNDLGYTKRYVRCLQIAEVVNCMKDLIDYSRQTGTGPMDSLNNFPRRNSSGLASSSQAQQQQSDQQQSSAGPNPINQNPTIANGPNSAHMTANQITNPNQSDQISNNAPVNPTLPTGTGPTPSPYPLVPVKQEIQNPNPNTNPNPIPNQVPIPNAGQNPMGSSLPSTSNNNNSMMPPTAPVQVRAPDAEDSQSSVQRILQEMMMSSQLNGVGTMGNSEMKPRINGVMPGLNGYGSNLMGGPSPGPGSSGMRASMSSGAAAMIMNGRVGMHQSHDPTVMTHGNNQQEMGGQMMGGLRAVNSFNNLYDWKPNQ
ncbi:SEUSS-like 2 [Rhynchospora pubera]|uniref:SEUSS-like 2 n=1 Tax=Rhynchospora pubera TaxID=906938 RepID=A0AAV8FPT2_9POAL|nr:SEUSS-like 2 [Rhynchospora pubera]